MTVPPEPFMQDAADDEAINLPPMPVYIVGHTERQAAPHFGAATFVTAPPAPGFVPLLNRRPGRHKARIRNNDTVNSAVIAETSAKLQAAAIQGYIVPANSVVEWESQQPVYVAALTAAVLVSVIDEAYILADDES